MCVLETVMRPSLFPGRLCMRQLIGSVLLLAAVGLAPAELAAQRRPAARSAASRADRPSFGLQLNWSSDVDFGIGGRGVFPLQSLFPKTPLDGIVSFDYFFPSVHPGVSAHYWEINGNVAYRFTVPARSSFRPYAGGGLNIAHASAGPSGGTSVSETKAGLNLLGGTTFKLKGSKLTPFAEAQATGMPSYNAPYRAFQRSELGGVFSFPEGGGTAFEGVYRYASGKFDIGLRGGFFDPGSGFKTVVLAGVEARQRVITHTLDFPLDGALMVGAGANLVSGGSALIIPAGLSLGRRIDPQGSTVSIVPYVQPTFAFIVGDFPSDLVFGFGVGADFRLSRVLDARVSGGLGDRPLTGVSIGAVWVH